MVGGARPGRVVLGCITMQAEKAIGISRRQFSPTVSALVPASSSCPGVPPRWSVT